jgi:hypothetical protein
MYPMRKLSTIVVLVVIASACAAPDAGDDEATTTTTTVPAVTSTTGGGAIDPGLNAVIPIAVTDLAERLGLPESEIEVTAAYLVSWPDASLGCPEPGMQYAQVVTDGAVIELTADATTYSYHMGGSRYRPFLCETPAGSIPPKDQTETTLGVGGLNPDPTDESVPPPGYDD